MLFLKNESHFNTCNPDDLFCIMCVAFLRDLDGKESANET